jgi:hypothetical protein
LLPQQHLQDRFFSFFSTYFRTRLSLIMKPVTATPRKSCEAVAAPAAEGLDAGSRDGDVLVFNLGPGSGCFVVEGSEESP